MLKPRVYVKSERKVFDKKKVFDVKEIHFDIDVVAIDDGVNFDYCELDFDEVEFIENTGYKDVDNKEIYVNDIVEFIYSLFPEPVIGIVNSDNQVVVNNVMYLDIKDLLTVSVKVVGNIYENKELLEDI